MKLSTEKKKNMLTKPEQLDQLRCEITRIPTKHFNHAARALALAEQLFKEREAAIEVVLDELEMFYPTRTDVEKWIEDRIKEK